MVLKINEQWAEKRQAELDVIEQMRQADAERKAEAQRNHVEFDQRVQATHAAQEAGTWQPPHIQTWHELGEVDRAARQAAEEQAKQAKLASLSPRDIWFSQLSLAQKEHMRIWEGVNEDLGLQWDMSVQP